MNRMAAGLADDLPGALFLAHDRTRPFLFAPAMNPRMWSHPATVAAIERLASWGAVVLPVESVSAGGVAQSAGSAKLASSVAPVLRLRLQPKRVDGLRALSLNREMRLVAFKLTCGAGADDRMKVVATLFDHSLADFVVHNDLGSRDDASGAFPADIFGPAGALAGHCSTRPELAAALERLLASSMHN